MYHREQSPSQAETATRTDRPALWLSILGGSAAGLISVRAALWSALTHQPMDRHARLIGHLIGFNLGEIIVPVIVTLIARRRPFLWACLAVGVKVFWTLTDRIAARNWPGFVHDLWDNSLGALPALLLFAGTTSLVRYLVRRSRERASAARDRAAQWQYPPAQEGVWPPPPTQSPEIMKPPET